MIIEEKRVGDVLVVNMLEQRLDAKVAVEFKEQMKELIGQGNTAFVIGLNSVNFIDSSGLGAIVSSLKILGKGGNMVISGTSEPVTSLFKLTRMDKVFRMYETEAEAVKAIS